jgi:hypothetical protein
MLALLIRLNIWLLLAVALEVAKALQQVLVVAAVRVEFCKPQHLRLPRALPLL